MLRKTSSATAVLLVLCLGAAGCAGDFRGLGGGRSSSAGAAADTASRAAAGQTGGIDLDVSKVRDRAKALDGKRVTVTGHMTDREWPERGTVQVLVAEKIEEAKGKDE